MTTMLPALHRIPVPGPIGEDVVVDAAGRVIVGRADGAILRIDEATGEIETLLNTGGHPTGLDFLADGRLLVCDARLGVLAADLRTAQCELLLDSIDGRRIRLCNNPSVAADGTIYFSESTTRHDYDEVHWDVLEGVPSGRLIAFRIGAAPRVLADGLLFANGVAVAPDQSFVVVAESTALRLSRYWLSGPRQGTLDVFAELPGLPDNVSVGSDGLLWVAMPSHGDTSIKTVHRFPSWFKKLLARLTHGKSATPKAFGLMAFHWDGRIVHDWVGDSATYPQPTGVREFRGTVYLSSIRTGDVARLHIVEKKPPLRKQT